MRKWTRIIPNVEQSMVPSSHTPHGQHKTIQIVESKLHNLLGGKWLNKHKVQISWWVVSEGTFINTSMACSRGKKAG